MEREPNQDNQPKQPVDLYRFIYPIAKLALDYKYHRNVINPENILDTPAIYAANHIHAVDSLLLTETYTEETGLPLRFVVKQGYADGTGMDDKGQFGRTARFVVNHTLQIPVSREGNDRANYQKFEANVKRTLERGDSFGIHPESTRSNDGRLYKFKAGAARLAIANKVPIVPVGFVYDTHTNSKKVDVNISFGEAIYPEDLEHLPYTIIPGLKNKADHLSQVLENRVAHQTGMSQTGVFAVLRKLRPPTSHRDDSQN